MTLHGRINGLHNDISDQYLDSIHKNLSFVIFMKSGEDLRSYGEIMMEFKSMFHRLDEI
jgi:hypothetical protein